MDKQIKKVYTKTNVIGVLGLSRTTYYRYRDRIDRLLKPFMLESYLPGYEFFYLTKEEVRDLQVSTNKFLGRATKAL